MPIRALLRPLAAGVLIVASAGAVAANASARQTAVAFAESTMPAWTQAAQTMPQERPLVAQFFADSRGEQAARIRAQMERMEARARADDRLNGRIQPHYDQRDQLTLAWPLMAMPTACRWWTAMGASTTATSCST